MPGPILNPSIYLFGLMTHLVVVSWFRLLMFPNMFTTLGQIGLCINGTCESLNGGLERAMGNLDCRRDGLIDNIGR